VECSCKACCCALFSVTHCCQSRLCSSKLPSNGASCLVTTSQKMLELFCGRNRAAAATSEKASSQIFVTTSAKSVFCSLASSIASQGCCEVVLRRQKQQTALKKPDKPRIAAQCMVLGTVAATSVASQPLRLDYITTKPLLHPSSGATALQAGFAHNGGTFGSWRALPTWTGGTGSYGGACCIAV